MTDQLHAPSPRRVVAYASGEDLDASRAFYTEVLGFEVAMEDPVLALTSPANRSALLPDREVVSPKRDGEA